MSLTAGSVTCRVWRALDALPSGFKEAFERNLRRHAFKPIDPERGELESLGWVNVRQMLDADLSLEKVLFRNLILVGLRVDRLAINQKLFRATLAQAIDKVMRAKERESLSREERLVLEDKVRLDLLKRTQPAVNVYEMAWHLEEGLVFFASTSRRLGQLFSDLFGETFQVSIEPRFPALRARQWAERQKRGQELLELLPSPFSPDAPREVIETAKDDESF
jgi:DNA recombination-dependent growth factor C